MVTLDEDVTVLARRLAEVSSDHQIHIRVSGNDAAVPVQVEYRDSRGTCRHAFGRSVRDAVKAAALQQEEVAAYPPEPDGAYPVLPGTPLGPHDSIILRGRETEPLEARIVWIHHAARTGNGKRRGDRCTEDGIGGHAVLVSDLDGITLSPAVTCSTCGRTGWITEGAFIPSTPAQTGDRRSGRDRRAGPPAPDSNRRAAP